MLKRYFNTLFASVIILILQIYQTSFKMFDLSDVINESILIINLSVMLIVSIIEIYRTEEKSFMKILCIFNTLSYIITAVAMVHEYGYVFYAFWIFNISLFILIIISNLRKENRSTV